MAGMKAIYAYSYSYFYNKQNFLYTKRINVNFKKIIFRYI